MFADLSTLLESFQLEQTLRIIESSQNPTEAPWPSSLFWCDNMEEQELTFKPLLFNC